MRTSQGRDVSSRNREIMVEQWWSSMSVRCRPVAAEPRTSSRVEAEPNVDQYPKPPKDLQQHPSTQIILGLQIPAQLGKNAIKYALIDDYDGLWPSVDKRK
ncbi:unnamed protein product [Linum trigynum]|uniref:Uncharacterized protein n=1 Tax=Linum trigynum TaxID=586398 RepID=A0AAV2GWG0_9ROSI